MKLHKVFAGLVLALCITTFAFAQSSQSSSAPPPGDAAWVAAPLMNTTGHVMDEADPASEGRNTAINYPNAYHLASGLYFGAGSAMQQALRRGTNLSPFDEPKRVVQAIDNHLATRGTPGFQLKMKTKLWLPLMFGARPEYVEFAKNELALETAGSSATTESLSDWYEFWGDNVAHQPDRQPLKIQATSKSTPTGLWKFEGKDGETMRFNGFHETVETDSVEFTEEMYVLNWDGFTAYVKPFSGSDDGPSMVVVLPKGELSLRDALWSYSGALQSTILAEAVRFGTPQWVTLKMPKIRQHFTSNLRLALRTPAALTVGAADFTGMLKTFGVPVGTIAHSSYLLLDKHGVGGATGGSAAPSVPEGISPIKVTVDRPFGLFLWEQWGLTLEAYRVYDIQRSVSNRESLMHGSNALVMWFF